MLRAGIGPLLAHEWGVSAGADRIWAEVCGRAPSTEPWRRVLMVAQIYADESYTQGQVYAIGGYIARAEEWAKFSEEWERLLPLTKLGSNKRRFKMAEMANNMDVLPLFYEVICRHVAFSISMVIDARDLRRAKERIWSDNAEILWDPSMDVPAILLKLFINLVYSGCWQDERVREWLGINDKIDLYLDENLSYGGYLDDWHEMANGLPDHIRELIGVEPRFDNDEELLPLQAADFWASWLRQGAETGRLREVMEGKFGSWTGEKVSGFETVLDEDSITKMLIDNLKRSPPIRGLLNIYDDKINPRTENAMDVFLFKKRSNFLSFTEQKWKTFKKMIGLSS